MALVPIKEEKSECTDLVPFNPDANSEKRSNSLQGPRRVQPSQNPNKTITMPSKPLALPAPEPAPVKAAPARPVDMDRLKSLSQPKKAEEPEEQQIVIRKKSVKPPVVPGSIKRKRNRSKQTNKDLSNSVEAAKKIKRKRSSSNGPGQNNNK